jgi:hypothetical protein
MGTQAGNRTVQLLYESTPPENKMLFAKVLLQTIFFEALTLHDEIGAKDISIHREQARATRGWGPGPSMNPFGSAG